MSEQYQDKDILKVIKEYEIKNAHEIKSLEKRVEILEKYVSKFDQKLDDLAKSINELTVTIKLLQTTLNDDIVYSKLIARLMETDELDKLARPLFIRLLTYAVPIASIVSMIVSFVVDRILR